MHKLGRQTPVALACVALLAVVGGPALAGPVAGAAKKITGKKIAKNAITTKHVKNGSLKLEDFGSKERDKLKGSRGAKGAQGDPGADGAAGAAGADGFGGGMGHTLFQNGATNGGVSFASLYGASNASSVTAEENAYVLSPNVTVVMSDLAVHLATAPGGGQTRTVLIRDDGVDTALSCTVSGTDTDCLSAGSITVAPRSVLSLKSIASAGVGTTQTAYSYIVRSP